MFCLKRIVTQPLRNNVVIYASIILCIIITLKLRDVSYTSKESFRMVSSNKTSVINRSTYSSAQSFEEKLDTSNTALEIDCRNIHEIVIRKKLGSGRKKVVHAGDYHGKKVAVKIVSHLSPYVRECLEKKCPSLKECYAIPYKAILNEILLSRQLNHPGIVPLLGYCVKDTTSMPDPRIPITDRGVVAVFQLGERYSTNKKYTLTKRLQLAIDLSDVLDYLSKSPVGSLLISDLRPHNAVLIHGRLTLSDIDFSSSHEPRCFNGTCPSYNVSCNREGICEGSNAIEMMDRAQSLFIPLLKPDSSSNKEINERLSDLLSSLKDYALTASQLKRSLMDILRTKEMLGA